MERLLALKASAGSGKTFSLVLRVLELLMHGAEPNEILALTFTKKAANEMRSRVFSALLELKNQKETPLLEEMAALGLDKKEILYLAPKIYERLLLGSLNVMTIDSFLHKILRKFCFYVGVSPTFSVKGDRDDELLEEFFEALDDREMGSFASLCALFERSEEYFLNVFRVLLSKQRRFDSVLSQKSSFIHLEEAKRLVLKEAQNIKDFVENDKNSSPSAINAVAFTSVEELLEKGKSWLTKDSLSEFSFFRKIYKSELDTFFVELKKALKDYFIVRESYFLEHLFEGFERFVKSRELHKKRKNSLSFDDVSFFVYELLSGSVDREFLYFRLDGRISHILIDEFQDTSTLQYKILLPLIDEIKAGSGQKNDRTLFMVGDVKQSIYRFRGGNSKLFGVASSGLVEKELLVNYRSKDEIIGFVNRTFTHKIGGYFPQSAKKSGGYVRVKRVLEPLDFVEDRVKELLKEGVCQSDIAILTFSNDDILEVQERLKESLPSISVVTETSSRLINSDDVKALINFIKYIHLGEGIYRANFLALIGRDPFGALDTRGYKSLSLQEMLFLAMREFSLFSDNALLFLEKCFSYSSVAVFVDEVEYMDTPVAPSSSDGIRVLTVHKSKGLEFSHVIVMDRLGRKPANNDPIIFRYKNLELDAVFLRSSIREYVDREYKELLDLEDELGREDLLNLLYVAFTRAKESLFVAAKDKSSEFDVLELADMESGELIAADIGDLHPLQKNIDIEYEALHYGSQDSRFCKNEGFAPNDYGALYFGLATHLAFENLEGASSGYLNSSMQFVRNIYGLFIDENSLKRIHKSIEELLLNPKTKELGGGKIYKEIPFMFGGVFGRIDFLALFSDRAVVLDFKSGEAAKEEYIKQVNFYKNGISKLLNIDTRGFLVLMGEGGFVEV